MFSAVWLCILFSCVHANKFGEQFTIFNVTDGKVFAYKDRTACIVHEGRDEVYARLRKIDTLESTKELAVYRGGGVCPEACFEYDGISYLWLRCTNGTRLMRGAEEMTLAAPPYDVVRYDYADGTVYALQGALLRRYAFEDVLSGDAVLSPQWSVTISGSPTDLMVVGGHVFAVLNGSVYLLDAAQRWQHVVGIGSRHFTFQLFLKEKSDAGVHLAEKIPPALAYCVEVGAVLFLAYCLRYRLTYRTATFEATPPSPAAAPAKAI